MKAKGDGPAPSWRWIVLLLAIAWMIFACGLPFQTAREARRQAHQQLAKLFSDGEPSLANIVTELDRSTQNVVAASTIPCFTLAVCILLLIHQMSRLKRNYHALEQDLRSCQVRTTRLTDHPLD